MFIRSVICCVLLAAVARADDGCAGGYSNGQQVVSGSYYYQCRSGTLQPMGCISDNGGQQIPIGQAWNSKGNQEKTCVQNGDNLTMKVTACYTDNGQRVAPNANMDVGTTTFQCQPDGDAYCLVVYGCAGAQQARIDDTIVVGDQVMKCTKTGTKVAQLKPAGCMKNGQKYDIGAQFSDDKAIYRCGMDESHTKTEAKTYGCVQDGKRIYDLDLYKEGDMFYRCRVNEDSVGKDVYGCARDLGNGQYEARVIGCSWEEGQQPYNYFTCCVKQPDGSAKVTQLYCLYWVDGGSYAINEGCYRTIQQQGVGCVRDPSTSKLSVIHFDPKDALQNRMSLC